MLTCTHVLLLMLRPTCKILRVWLCVPKGVIAEIHVARRIRLVYTSICHLLDLKGDPFDSLASQVIILLETHNALVDRSSRDRRPSWHFVVVLNLGYDGCQVVRCSLDRTRLDWSNGCRLLQVSVQWGWDARDLHGTDVAVNDLLRLLSHCRRCSAKSYLLMLIRVHQCLGPFTLNSVCHILSIVAVETTCTTPPIDLVPTWMKRDLLLTSMRVILHANVVWTGIHQVSVILTWHSSSCT